MLQFQTVFIDMCRLMVKSDEMCCDTGSRDERLSA